MKASVTGNSVVRRKGGLEGATCRTDNVPVLALIMKNMKGENRDVWGKKIDLRPLVQQQCCEHLVWSSVYRRFSLFVSGG